MFQKIGMYLKEEPQSIMLCIGCIMFIGGIKKAEFLCGEAFISKKSVLMKIFGQKKIYIFWIFFGILFIFLSICMFFI